ncbi:RES family NAD+ phosphorylase [uncultured Enterovirga sp.]|uniref:RES family NAD+ phosphorylase n=1 Tax=uncultured Enterovirga sp. TaxID=2026352 RepID=UPI0035CABA5E
MLPPAGFGSRPLDLHEVAPGEIWRRLYGTRHPDPLGFGRGASRFSDARTGILDADRFGVVYLGSTLKVCFLEAILRDRGNGRLGDWLVEAAELDGWSCAEIVVDTPLRLVDLRGDGPARMGIPSDALRASSQGLGQAWSAAVWAHDERPDGLIYSSRLNEDTNVVVYDRALPKLRATATPRLLECRSELADVLRDLAVALI